MEPANTRSAVISIVAEDEPSTLSAFKGDMLMHGELKEEKSQELL